SHTYTGSTHGWKISRFDLPDFTIHNAFLKNGTEVDYRYIGAYEGSMWDASAGAMVLSGSITTDMYASGDKLCSYSGEFPKTYESRSEFRAMARERGGGWRQQDFDLISAVQLLYLIEYANFNSQSKIGMGRTEISGGTWAADSNIGQCGKSNSDGDSTNSTDEYMTYRGIENFYGNVWSWVDGINIKVSIPWACNDDTFWVDDSTTNYVSLDGTFPFASGYQTVLIDTDRGFLPHGAGAGVNCDTYICDYYHHAAGYVVALGGDADSAAEAGAFCIERRASTDDELSMGGRLAY
ncbi:MAG: hypothetical protein KAJ06_05995, partial [Gammaproteobacteria bacterium]|nr:hypothetical protein [Gammaproteobacteria bacterium]